MDAVYTYVDGDDPAWRAGYAEAAGIPLSDIRFRDHGELALSVRLLMLHCPWVRRVHVVHAGDGVRPDTLAALERAVPAGRLRVVPQRTLVDGGCYSSCAVEARLWRLPGLTPTFLYLNDDMMVGRPLPLAAFVGDGGRPWLDCSAVPAGYAPVNTAQQHCDNAWKLLYPFTRPRLHAPHFPAVVSVEACRRMWAQHPGLDRALPPIRTPGTVNPQLLATLIAARDGLGTLRTRAHLPPHRLARAFVEAEPDGLAHVLEQCPHFFCVNGVDAGSERRFAAFAQQYLAACRRRIAKRAAYPAITEWTYPH